VQETEDPYSFGVVLGDSICIWFNEGRHFELAEALGANVMTIDGVRGVRFAVWAPNASRVAVVGDFNSWDARRPSDAAAPQRRHLGAVLPRVAPGARYKYDIIGAGGIRVPAQGRSRSPSRASLRPRPGQS
jgi:1,4-alpha-glucan branching enzyme